ncbi:DUF2188 domain-containing protein [Exiguobacterium artemiae]
MANQHITPHPDGGYQVIEEGASTATERFLTQKEAITARRKIAKDRQVELIIHNKEGQIRDKDSYGNDPFPHNEIRPANDWIRSKMVQVCRVPPYKPRLPLD